MKSKKGSNNYLVKGEHGRYESSSIRRFFTHVGTIKWGNDPIYLRVSYGQAIDNKGKVQTFFNDGEYTDKKEFTHALKAFLE